jgi:hypothetical protein
VADGDDDSCLLFSDAITTVIGGAVLVGGVASGEALLVIAGWRLVDSSRAAVSPTISVADPA